MEALSTILRHTLCLGLSSLIFLTLDPSRAAANPEDSSTTTVTEQEFQQAKQWYNKLGFPTFDQLPLVKVATGSTFRRVGEEEQNTYVMAFLLKKAELPKQPQFTVLTLTGEKKQFLTTPDGKPESQRVGYKVVDFKAWLATYLAPKKGKKSPDDTTTNLSSSSHFMGSSPVSAGVITFHLSMASEQHGYHKEAVQLMAMSRRAFHPHKKEKSPDWMTLVQQEFGHSLMWSAVVHCDKTTYTRPQLRDEFRRIVTHCPKSRHCQQASTLAAILDRMIKEDKAHQMKRAHQSFDTLNKEEKIKDLIFQLRNQDGVQFSQPGSCSIFGFGSESNSPADQLVSIGFAAIPYLIEAMQDDSLTYSVEFHRNFYYSHRVLRVGEAAKQVVEKITGQRFRAPQEIRVFGEDPGESPVMRSKTALQKEVTQWWETFKAKGERQFLIDEVSAGKNSASSLAELLLEKYPEEARTALLKGLRNAKDEWAHSAIVRCLDHDKIKDGDTLLRGVVKRNRFNQGTLTALNQLKQLGAKDTVKLTIGLLDQKQSWQDRGFMSDMVADKLIEFLLESREQAAYQKVLDLLPKLSLSQRIDVILTLSVIVKSEQKPEPPSLKIAEQFLVKQLQDQRKRVGMSGSIGDHSYDDPRPCDLAAEVMRSAWPKRYQFDYKAPIKTRNRQCFALLNQWRTAHQLPPLANKERKVEPMPVEEFHALIKKHAIDTDQGKQAFTKAILQKSIGSLPHLIELAASTPPDNRLWLTTIIQNLSNRIESVTILPAGKNYAPVSNWKKSVVGKPLNGEQVVRLMSSFYKHASPNGQKIRGIKFEAVRHSDLSGVDIRLTLVAKERPKDEIDQWNGNEKIISAGKQIHWAGYGGMLSKDDPDESQDLAEGVNKATQSPPNSPYEIHWQLIGWWHDDD